jgi:methylene-tetrahydromethanopterin dehydrogenase
MEKPYLLHFATPADRVSPFDVNMAYDAGWNAVIPYAGVGLDDIAGFTQDAIFSRGPKGVKRTGIFIGGRDALLADAMLSAARAALVPPFECSLFADPSGAYTTAAAMLAKVEASLQRVHGLNLKDRQVVVFGGTGPVGMIAAALAALAGARVTLPGHDGLERSLSASEALNRRFGLAIMAADASEEASKQDLLAGCEVLLCTAKAGVEVISARHLQAAGRLRVAADINAVPPAGIAGLGAFDDAVPLAGAGQAVGIGPLAIGNLKYRLQQGLLQTMLNSEKPLCLDWQACFAEARRHVG